MKANQNMDDKDTDDGSMPDEGCARLPGRSPSNTSLGGLSIGSDAGLSMAPPESSHLSSTLTDRLSATRQPAMSNDTAEVPLGDPALPQGGAPIQPWAVHDHPGPDEPSARLPLAASVKGFVDSSASHTALPSRGLKVGAGAQPLAQPVIQSHHPSQPPPRPPPPQPQKAVLQPGTIMAVPGREGSAPTYVVEEVVDFELPDERIREMLLEQEFPFGCDAGGRMAPPFFGTCVPRTCAQQDPKGKCV
mmetsp:Transcript_25751/g.60127  ORF Transcript_25751/g.60127 Transcript_25751/m.60127 type:complete len:247 (+) Transcript_25751:143-883(+)